MAGYALLAIGIFAIIVVMSLLFGSVWKYRRDVVGTIDPNAPKLELSTFDKLMQLTFYLLMWSMLIRVFLNWRISYEMDLALSAMLLIIIVYNSVVMHKKCRRYKAEYDRYQKSKRSLQD